MSSPNETIEAVLPKSWSQKKRKDLANAINDALWEAGQLLVDTITTVEVCGAMVPVETVEAYGLSIRVDANGDAAEISARAGLEILA